MLQQQQAGQQLLFIAKQREGDVPFARVFRGRRLTAEGQR